MVDSDAPPDVGNIWKVLEHWDAVLTDMNSTIRGYRTQGWEVLELHPGDVTPLDSDRADRFGLDILVPDNELEELEALLADAELSFDSFEVYKRDESGHTFLLLLLKDPANEFVIAYPAYYEVQRARDMLDEARERGELRTHLRNLADDRVVSITHDDPELFFPDE